jgi:hypothetical protein
MITLLAIKFIHMWWVKNRKVKLDTLYKKKLQDRESIFMKMKRDRFTKGYISIKNKKRSLYELQSD